MPQNRKPGPLPPGQPAASEDPAAADPPAAGPGDTAAPARTWDCIPEEILAALSREAHAGSCPDYLLPRHPAAVAPEESARALGVNKPLSWHCLSRVTVAGMPPTSKVWQCPGRRGKFRFLTDHPVSFSGAGRDVSFLYDMKAEKLADSWLPNLVKEITAVQKVPEKGLSIPSAEPRKLADTLIPEEFHIVSNTGVKGLQYYDDKYTTLLTDSKNRLLLFPSMKPNKRIEVIQLKNVMDMMLEKAGVDTEKRESITQMHKLLELLKTEQNIYNTAFHEIIRQITVECSERGELLSDIRQRYVNLLDQIARQMIEFYKDMVAQRIMDKRIIEELYNFKKVIEELSRELLLVREYDSKLKKKSEKIHEELVLALTNAKKSAKIVEEYHDLHTSQRLRLETDIKQLTSERDIWSSATYDLALKVIKRNNLILARRLYLNEKAWNKYVTHFIVMLATQDATDLSLLQKATHQWRNLFIDLKHDMEQNEDSIRQSVNFTKNILLKLQKLLEKTIVAGILIPVKESTMQLICADLKKCQQMLLEDYENNSGDKLFEKTETLKIARRLQGSWAEYGRAIMKRHKTVDGNFSPQETLMEEINEYSSKLCREYELRVNGDENGYNNFFKNINSTFETWIYKMENEHSVFSMNQADWKILYAKIPKLLSLLDRMLDITGVTPSNEEEIKNNLEPIIQIKVFNLIQQWILTMSNGTDKDTSELHRQVNEFHISMIKWMVNLLILMVPDITDEHTLPNTELDEQEKEIHFHTDLASLNVEGMSLAKSLSRFSVYLFSCCKSTVATKALKKASSFDPDANKEVEELTHIKKECIAWISTCNILLSELKGKKVTLLTAEDTRGLDEYELQVDNQTYSMNEWEKTFGEMAYKDIEESYDSEKSLLKDIFEVRQLRKTERLKEDDGKGRVKVSLGEIAEEIPEEAAEETVKETAEETPKTIEKEVVVHFLARDKNIHARPLEIEYLYLTKEERLAFANFAISEQERHEAAKLMEYLKTKLLDTEVRVQLAEEKYEKVSERLTEEIEKNQELEKELEKTNTLLLAASAKEQEEVEQEEKQVKPAAKKVTPTVGKEKERHHGKPSKAQHKSKH
ncbi:axonemal dynein light chain domain-containing protein 1 [Macrotis lagotis]|uniref:axonemal dynein light chain domain-containing protein 1 n=1 Tax=Macrotis lagotis TaxID=92651 RepID=UPI003D692FE9